MSFHFQKIPNSIALRIFPRHFSWILKHRNNYISPNVTTKPNIGHVFAVIKYLLLDQHSLDKMKHFSSSKNCTMFLFTLKP